MKKFLILASALLMCFGANAQTISKSEITKSKPGSLTKEDIKDIQNSFVLDGPTTALQNILTNNKGITQFAYSREALGKLDDYFKYKTDVRGITNQLSSGRCWLFCSQNEIRTIAAKKFGVKEFYFSQNYNSFWDLFEKSNLFLENVIATASKDMDDREVAFYFKSPVGDGGVWNLFIDIAEKYGAVPADVMPETEQSNNTAQMRSILNEKLRTGGWELREAAAAGAKMRDLRKQKIQIMKEVYRILALCLGNPPEEFTWRYKDTKGEVHTLTSNPLDFYHSIVPPHEYNSADMVMIMNDPTRPYYQVYEIASYRNTMEGVNWIYLNLPMDEIRDAALASIKDNNPVYTSSDVGKYCNRETCILDLDQYDYESLFGITLNMDKKARILTRQSGSSHAMLLVACDTDENDKPVKWMFENSWGPKSCHNGYMILTNEWFDAYLFRIVLHRKYITNPDAVRALGTKPVMLPAWDYMN